MGKRSWKLLSMSALLLTGVLFLSGCDVFGPSKSSIEKESVSVVNKMLKENNIVCTCTSVRINKELGNDSYQATASTTEGPIGVIIEIKGKMIYAKLDFEDQSSVMLFAKTIINNNNQYGVKCTRLSNPLKTGDNEYLATAHLSNGESGNVKITVSGNYVQVTPVAGDDDEY